MNKVSDFPLPPAKGESQELPFAWFIYGTFVRVDLQFEHFFYVPGDALHYPLSGFLASDVDITVISVPVKLMPSPFQLKY
jgi:hypothetical protein